MCVCVCVRGGGGGGGGRKRVCVCEFCVICWYQYFRQKYVLEEEGAKPEKSRSSYLFTLQPTQTCVRERKRERERMGGGGGGGGGRKRVCVNFVSFAGISTSVKNMSLKRRVLSQRNPDPPICSHYNLRRHIEYILTLNSLSLSPNTHIFWVSL